MGPQGGVDLDPHGRRPGQQVYQHAHLPEPRAEIVEHIAAPHVSRQFKHDACRCRLIGHHLGVPPAQLRAHGGGRGLVQQHAGDQGVQRVVAALVVLTLWRGRQAQQFAPQPLAAQHAIADRLAQAGEQRRVDALQALPQRPGAAPQPCRGSAQRGLSLQSVQAAKDAPVQVLQCVGPGGERGLVEEASVLLQRLQPRYDIHHRDAHASSFVMM